MSFFSKKESKEDLKSVTESLYKQNLEIALKNKTLSLLSKLYEISLLTLEPKELAVKITTVIQSDFNLELVGIFFYNKASDELVPLGVQISARLSELESKYKYFFDTTDISSTQSIPFLKAILRNKRMGYTEHLYDIWSAYSSDDVFQKIEVEGHIRSTIVYPLITGDKMLGILVLSLNRLYPELNEHEKESIGSFINVITIALDKALLDEQLRLTNAELEESNDRQEGLIHFISHEVKGFLTKNLAIFASIGEKDYGEVSPQLATVAEYGMKETRKGVETVLDILNASNFKKGTVTYNMQVFDLKQTINQIVNDLNQAAKEKGLDYILDLGSDDYSHFKGDKEQLEKHVFRNIIDNAIKYTPKGEVKIKLQKSDGKIIFSVKDSGIGITGEDRERLFTEGGRGKESIKVNVNSTGYGLYIAKSIVEAHQGRIWAESTGRDLGTTFYVELPG